MKFIGFSFDKISAERLSNQRENLKINTNIDISDIKKVDSNFLETKEKLLKVEFTYVVDYSPNFAKLEFKGNLIISLKENNAKEVLEKWKDKETNEDFKIKLFNLVLRKSNLKALQLEEEMNLPLHISLPSIIKKEETKNKKE